MECKKYIKISIANPLAVDQGRKSIQVLVDPGKVYTYLPRGILENLGLKSTGKMDFLLEDGGVIQRAVGHALILSCSHYKRNAVVPVAFIEELEGKEPTLGATGLESLNLIFNVASQRLEPVIPVLPTITRVQSQ